MADRTTRSFAPDELLAQVAVPQTKPFDRGLPRPWRIALKNSTLGITLVFDLMDSVMIGRECPDDTRLELIDLGPYNAFQSGVSRRHAILKLDDNRVFIVDNNSSNGVVLNDEILSPGIAYPVRHGDTIKLGMMHLQINFLVNPFSR